MQLLGLSGSNVGSKTKTAMEAALRIVAEKEPNAQVSLIDLAEYDIPFADGRDYRDYEGDAFRVAKAVMEADIILIGTPTFQASIPAVLKNVFDLLPPDAFSGKTVGIIVTAGTPKHFLMAEHQLKPILTYMKALIVPAYVFIEEKDYSGKELANPDILMRINHLVSDMMVLHSVSRTIRRKKESQ